MELPIRVMIVLFVAVAVGGLVIVFSQQLLLDAREGVRQIGPDDVREGHIIELSTIQSEDVIRLAEQCVRDYQGTFDEIDCFAVFLNNPVVMPSNQTITQSFSFNTTLVESTAFRITFQPTQARVIAR